MLESLKSRIPVASLGLVLFATIGGILAFWQKVPCRFGGAWNYGDQQFARLCYTDIYPLYFGRGMVDGKVPYLEHEMEYPVGIGMFMHFVAELVRPLADHPAGRAVLFFDVTVIVMAVCLIIGTLAMSFLAGPARRWDAVWYAISPAVVLTAYINWDLLVGAIVLVGLVAWARGQQVVAGVLLGLAIATKFYPVVLLGPLLVLTIRTGKWRALGVTAGAAAAAWLAVNLPIMLTDFKGWARFYEFSAERGVDWGSIWFYFTRKAWPVLGDPESLDTIGIVSLAVLCLAIAVLVLTAPRRPRFMQVCFLVVAAFMLTNKVWSPQYVLWLVPFAVLARPRWPALAVWMATEIWYFVAIWRYLLAQQTDSPLAVQGISEDLYFTAVGGRALAVVLLMALVVWDILRPASDIVRRDGVDDPSGGVFAGAPDRFLLRVRPRSQTPDLVPKNT
ncbi:glycosyltransferase family 87 protein [Rhizohabitans arisaemae]|uniref:glycosyltransferase family 87 protein n=1 Tax=Rhizohabitans arisaemae TaxID=2720610 RepID=UPI0024B26F5E|nr:glycosyltransferase 87 family protein [Rhizohabitans arisaemae]